MDVIMILRIVLIAFTLVFSVFFIKDCIAHKEDFTQKHFVALALTGLFTNLLDTWGIGSFATTQAAFKFTKSSPDEVMPGTLNVGDTIPVVLEAVLFFSFVAIDPLTLTLMIGGAVVGAVLGAGIVSKWSVKYVRFGLGASLLVLAFVLAAKNAQIGPFGMVGTAMGLTGIKLVIGVVGNFLLGALMTIGVGLYAPCMALTNALGMSPAAAFPIMMGSCAYLMPAAGIKFIKEGKYDRKAAAMLSIFGVIGVVIAYRIASMLPMSTLTWIVIAVMLYTSFTFFRDAVRVPAEKA